MNIAYIILAHKNITQVRRLLDAIQGENIYIYLHLDRLAGNSLFSEAAAGLKDIQNLVFIKRFPTNWGSFGLIRATLEGLRQISKNNGIDYAILLSGQDYPLKRSADLLGFLEQNKSRSFLQYHQLPSSQWPPDGPRRYTHWHFNLGWKDTPFRKLTNRILNRIFNTLFPQRILPDGLAPFGGWQWWCLNRDGFDYVLDYAAKHPRVVDFFRHVRIPDEMFFHTILLNSPLHLSIQNRLLTYVDWQGPPYPKILVQADFNKLKDSGFFFARKFDMKIDTLILDRIDHELLKR